jgi:excisionase family DNA binding protein
MPPDPPSIDLEALAERVAEHLAERLTSQAQRRYLTVAHAAEYSDLSTDSIRSLISAGKLTALRPVPGRIVIDRRELDALLASSTRRPRRGRGVYDRTAGAGSEDLRSP